MAISKEMEDWFLRGGKRPEANGMQETLPKPDENPVDDDVISCPHCGGENLASEKYCTHCGRPLHDDGVEDEDDDDDGGERDYVVTMTRTRVVSQRAKVRVRARSESDAMDKAEDLAVDEQDQWSWKDDEDTEEFEDVEADDVEEFD